MGFQTNININFNQTAPLEYIRVKKNNGTITGQLTMLTFKDKDTKQFIFYIPSLLLSSYGQTAKKAEQMIALELREYCLFLLNSKMNIISKELKKMGWKHDTLKSKQYSKTYVGIDGALRDFNAEDKVEMRLVPIAA